MHERFRDESGANAKRQRGLVLDLSAATEPVPVGKVPELTPRLARCYAGTSAKTLQRDLAAVEELVLLPASFVAQSLQIHADMRLLRASPAAKIPAP